MTVTHEITATIGAYTLEVIDAKVTLDEAWSPYAQAELQCHLPSAATLAAIDPTAAPRVAITVTRDGGAQSRTFDLVLASREVDHLHATMTLLAASDEQLLMAYARFAPTVADNGAYLDLRNIIDGVVLDLWSTSLETDAGANWDATIDTDATNLINNPSGEVNASGWFSADFTLASVSTFASYGSKCIRATPVATGTRALVADASPSTISATAGRPYCFSFLARAGSTAANFRAEIRFLNSAGATISDSVSTYQSVVSGSWQRIEVSGLAPAGTAKVWPIIRSNNIASTGHLFYFDEVLLTETDDFETYFDGSTPASALYTYSWTGTAHASASRRTGNYGRDPEMLSWEPGETARDYLEPLVQASGLRFYCDEARDWHLIDPATTVAGTITIADGSNLTEAVEQVALAKEWFDAVVIEYAWTDAAGVPQRKWDTAYTGTPKATLALAFKRPYPGPGAAQAILERAQTRGRPLQVRALSDYLATPGKAVNVTLPGATVISGVLSAVTWRFPEGEMTIRTRAPA